MKLKKMIKVAALAACTLLGVTAGAAEWTYNGQKVSYTGTAVEIDNGNNNDLLLKFTSSGTLTLPGKATADILVVGGGGDGGATRKQGKTTTSGSGGDGGDVEPREGQSMSKGDYTITVGGAGGASKLEGSGLSLVADGGEAGSRGGNNAGDKGEKSGAYTWTGSSVVYGEGGTVGSGNGSANTGKGGGGATTSGVSAGSGGSGVVFVRITSLKPIVDGGTKQIAVGGDPLSFTDEAWGSSWTCSSADENTAKAEKSGANVVVAGKNIGQTTISVENDTTVYTYTINVVREQKTVDFYGDTITYAGAEVARDGTDLVFTFNDLEGGNLNLPADYKADILVVGGGSGGVRAKSSSNNKYTGNGGNGGSVVPTSVDQMPAGTYTIQVGAGGAGASAGSNDFTGGGAGGQSSIGGVTGFTTLTANGGAAWLSQDNGGSGTKDSSGAASDDGASAANGTSDITGTTYTYGKGGSGVKENCASTVTGANADEYGEGGGGSANGGASGAGYQGVVIVRLSPNLPVVESTAETFVGRSKALSFEGTASTVGVADENIATATLDKTTNTVTIEGVAEGTTSVSVVTKDAIYRYTVTVSPGQVLNRKVLLAKGGNNTQTSYTLTFDAVESVSTYDTTVADVTWSADGKTMTVTPKKGGTTQLTVESLVDEVPSTYNFTITVDEFTDNVAPFGESYIVYTGAEPQTVDGDLVLVFDETGSFSVPSPYTATMDVLAVGGGGAGGSQPVVGVGAAGGGAGGFTLKEGLTLAGGTYTVAVGAGGTASDGNTAEPGRNGQPSSLTDANDHAYVSAQGGGGGGAPVVNGNNGQNGGSGGGATWFLPEGGSQYIVGAAGTGVGGQGWRGNVPTAYGAGGAGGGAGGRGGEREDDTTGLLGGLGVKSEISGAAVTYAQGGDGAARAVTTAGKALDGVNPGDGGDGGNGTTGGAGADGVVVVRFSKLSQNILVPVPTEADILALRHEWANGKTFAGLKDGWMNLTFRSVSDGRTYTWGDVVNDIYYAGDVANVTCTLNGETKVGVGYYNFTISLKSGFAWVDSSADPDPYGDAESKSFRWSIVADLANVDAEVRIEKYVSKMDGPNARVTVDTFSSPEIAGMGRLKVLMVGTACAAHGMDKTVVNRSLQTILNKADVTFCVFDSAGVWNAGSFKQGDTVPDYQADFDESGHGHHYAAGKFYSYLYEELVEKGNVYDYIVFEFDGSRVAMKYGGGDDPAVEASVCEAVVQKLIPFYANQKVIWITDEDVKNDPWSGVYWTPNTYAYNTSGGDNKLTEERYRALIGLFDPVRYEDYDGTYASISLTEEGSITTSSGVQHWRATRNENQVSYNNAEDVAELLDRVIQPKPYNLVVTDKIVEPAKGLTVKAVSLMVCTNGQNGVASENPNDWHVVVTRTAAGEVTKSLNIQADTGIEDVEMTVVGNDVSAVLKNIDFPVWTKLDIDVLDDGTFRTSMEDAHYNPVTGWYDKNPNDGKAHAELTTVEGDPMGVEGWAETQVPWSFETFKVTGDAVNGEIFVGLSDTDYISAAPGATVEVSFRGYPGYTLSRVTIDGEEQLFDATTRSVTIENIQKDMHVHVEYVSFVDGKEVVSAPVVNPYDGYGHLIEVALVDNWGLNPDDYEIRYSLDGNADAKDYLTAEAFLADEDVRLAIKDVIGVDEDGEYQGYEIFYRVFVKQLGYEGFVDTGVTGSDFSVITPLPITVKPADHEVIYVGAEVPTDFTITTKGLVEGEGLDDLVADIQKATVSTVYKQNDPKGAYKTWVEGLTDGKLYGNYVVNLEPNALFVEKWPIFLGWGENDEDGTKRPRVMQIPDLDPETMDTGVDRVEVDYDGQPHSLEVLVTGPKGDELYTEYDVEGGTAERFWIPTAPWYENPEWADYDLEYYWDENNGTPTDDSTWSKTNPEFVKAGTYKVWYRVTPKNVDGRTAGNWYLGALNYNYVVINPIEITVQSGTAEKTYDKTPLTKNEAWIIEGSLVNGDQITFNVTGSQQNVGTSDNTFGWTITRTVNGEVVDVTESYAVTDIKGLLTVKPAPIIINDVTQSDDPEKPLAPEASGVKDVEVYYFGGSTNISVDVVLPPKDTQSDDVFTVLYTLTPEVEDSWKTYDEFTDCVNVGEYLVWYRVESHLDGSEDEIHNYIPVENYAKVTIKPREVTVVAEDKMKAKGATDPELTATITTETPAQELWPTNGAGVLPGEEDLIAYELVRKAGEDVGEYPIAQKAATDEEQTYGESTVTVGNYKITVVPGKLTIVEAVIISLWITDHADAGTGRVHLAFNPTMNEGAKTRAFFTALAAKGGIRVVYGKTEADLATATPMAVPLRANWDRDFDSKGWVWVTVPVPEGITAEGQVWKIDIQL